MRYEVPGDESSAESLGEISQQGLSGGSGEHKQDSCDSEIFFADDELDKSVSEFHSLSHQNARKDCRRCHTELQTKSKYCRYCYNTRRIWMPAKPTRRLRRKHSQNGRSVVHQTRSHSRNRGFSPFSLLCRVETHTLEESSSDSNIDFEAERREERIKRREYVKKILEDISSSESSQCQSESNECLKCGSEMSVVIVIHGDTAHKGLCKKCATQLHTRRIPCPLCDRIIDCIIQESIDSDSHL